MGDYKRNHYVPKWYQYRFFEGNEKEKKFFYLDLNPEIIRAKNGGKFSRKSLLRWGPPRCFYEDDLYTTTFLEWKSTEIEQYFFGKIDKEGQNAVDYFTNFTHPSVDYEAFGAFLPFMSVQKLRTPKGLKNLSSVLKGVSQNEILYKMQELHKMHCALWTECVWCIVDASHSNTKFICSDHPVTVYNKDCFPASKWCKGANDPGILLNGTHTIFPLSLNKALLLTNLSWVRNPYGNPLNKRTHSQLFRTAMFKYTDIQINRYLAEEEVIAINYVIKKRAYRYIAASKKEWLYPENQLGSIQWDSIGKSYLLMPDPRSMTFSSEIIMGSKNGKTDAFDEYGRKPWHSDYLEKERHDYEWHTSHAFKGEYARKYGPKRIGIFYNMGRIDSEVDDSDYHKYHLSLEQKHKHYIKLKKKSRKNK